MTIGRIGGPMLKEDLVRQGVDLSFETNLLYLDVNNKRIGVNTATPNVAMDINGITRFSSNLQINGSNIATYASNGNITLTPHGTGKVQVSYLTANRIPYVGTNGALLDSSNLTFNGTTLSAANVNLGNVSFNGNSIQTININGDLLLDPEGTGSVIIDTVDVEANRVLYSGVNKEIISNANLTFNGTTFGATLANITTLNAGNIQTSTNTITTTNTNGNIILSPNGTGNVLLATATANLVTYTGPDKELLTNSNLKFDGTTLQIGNVTLANNNIATTSGNLVLTSSSGSKIVADVVTSIRLPIGDTSQRPSPVAGDFRFNTEFGLLEFYNGQLWQTLSADTQILTVDAYNGDGSTSTFTLSQASTSVGSIVTLNGVVQSPGIAYGVTGTALTFTEAPAVGDRIDVRFISLSNVLSLSSIAEGDTSVAANTDVVDVNINGNLKLQVSSAITKINNGFATTAPVTKTTDFTLADSENFVINNKTGSACVVTLPSASNNIGRQVTFKTLQAQNLTSASSNVCPIDSATPGTTILSNTVGKWATLVSDGTNWVIMAAN